MPTGLAVRDRIAGRVPRTAALAAVVLLLCGLALTLAYANKARCTGGVMDETGRSLVFDVIKDRDVCYSDIQLLWVGRDIDRHVFPYVDGGISDDGEMVGGAVEYPVLSGLLMWVGALGADNDAEFLLYSALLLAPFALLTALLLVRLAGPAALLWAGGPPLVLYAFHNWELPVVCMAVAAVYVMTAWTRYSVRTRGILAAVLLGIGFCLKLYPGIFVLPLMLFVLTRGTAAERKKSTAVEGAPGPYFDVRGALQTGAAALATIVALNLPFAIAGYEGWRASFTFQQLRQADITTNSIWYWGFRRMFGPDMQSEADFQHAVTVASPVLVFAAFALAIWLGWKRFLVTGTFPWVGVSGAMLCGFLLFHKVHSPQYTLWLLPFLVLLQVRWSLIGAYLVADAAIGIGVFRYFYSIVSGSSVELTETVVQLGVWGRAALLVVLFFVFLRAMPRGYRPAPPPVPRYNPGDLVPVA